MINISFVGSLIFLGGLEYISFIKTTLVLWVIWLFTSSIIERDFYFHFNWRKICMQVSTSVQLVNILQNVILLKAIALTWDNICKKQCITDYYENHLKSKTQINNPSKRDNFWKYCVMQASPTVRIANNCNADFTNSIWNTHMKKT